jgi:para-aminobenzoate synthetase component 1
MAYCIWKSYKLKIEPLLIFSAFKNEKNCFFLDSSLNSDYSQGRFSFLGIDPFFVLKTKGQNPFGKLREALNKYNFSPPQKFPIPFLGGAVGYLTYDLGVILEKKIKKLTKKDLGIPDCFFGFYNTVVVIDHLKKLLYLFALGLPETKYHLAKSQAVANFKKVYNLISNIPNVKKPLSNADIRKSLPAGRQATQIYADKSSNPRPSVCNLRESAFKDIRLNSNFTKEKYLLAIKKAKEYIKTGDIYQVNLSQSFQTRTNLTGFEIYQRLRQISPSYFSAYFDAGGFQILSASPERFLKLEGNIVITRPMKGTRPRAKDKIKDRKLRQGLLESVKDKAELVMIVDLERNDLGRVCSYDSVKVIKLRELEEYSTVFQTTATIQGHLHKDKDRIDLLRACFPGGSITGCPKIRAMEIIEELEPNRRTIYTGCLGYLSFSGNMDFNILIRTILKKENQLYFGSGGGIVIDSIPENEYEETLVKAKAMAEAINEKIPNPKSQIPNKSQ